jgi:hypothetical protein
MFYICTIRVWDEDLEIEARTFLYNIPSQVVMEYITYL